VKLKAEFPNESLQLWPGQFVNVKLLVGTLKDATVVPTASVQRGPNGTFVYVANDDNTVSVRPVSVSQQDDVRAVLIDGVDTGERVVTTGFAQLNDGTRITIGTQEKLDRPAGSERRRKGPIPTAAAEPKPTTAEPKSAKAEQAQDKSRQAETAATASPATPAKSGNTAASTSVTTNGTAPSERPAAANGATPRSASQKRSTAAP
jgi:membrane fusion protein, multidrug efflux system